MRQNLDDLRTLPRILPSNQATLWMTFVNPPPKQNHTNKSNTISHIHTVGGRHILMPKYKSNGDDWQGETSTIHATTVWKLFGLQSMLLLEWERMMGNCETVCALDEQYIFDPSYSPLVEGIVVCNGAPWPLCNRVSDDLTLHSSMRLMHGAPGIFHQSYIVVGLACQSTGARSVAHGKQVPLIYSVLCSLLPVQFHLVIFVWQFSRFLAPTSMPPKRLFKLSVPVLVSANLLRHGM
jgi:hypothetical protein